MALDRRGLEWLLGLAILLAALGLDACSRSNADAMAANAHPSSKPARDDSADRTVKIDARDAARMGIVVTRAAPAQFTPEIEGYGVIVNHDAIAQAVAEAGTADAMARQSHAALNRMDRLANTAGADTLEAHEAAQRQVTADQIAVTLAQRRLSTLLGQHPPWTQGDDDLQGGGELLQEVASGRVKLARITFPLGAIRSGVPRSLRLARLDAQAVSEQWRAHPVWIAPADTAMLGRSFFALLPDISAEEGERLVAWAPKAGAVEESGAWIPAAAAVAEGGQYWCYVQRGESAFERVPLDTSRPVRDGYFVTALKVNDAVVSTGAGLLLARELNSDSEAH